MFPLIKCHYKIICDIIIIFKHYLLRIQGLFYYINAVQHLKFITFYRVICVIVIT